MKVLELNEKNFSEFGSVLKIDEKFCFERFNSFNCYLFDSMKSNNDILIIMLEVFKELKEVEQLERHHLTEEVIMPIKGKAELYVANPNKSILTIDDISVFNIEPGFGVKLYKNVWHAIPNKKSKEVFLCLILKTKTTDEDLYYAKLSRSVSNSVETNKSSK